MSRLVFFARPPDGTANTGLAVAMMQQAVMVAMAAGRFMSLWCLCVVASGQLLPGLLYYGGQPGSGLGTQHGYARGPEVG